MRRWYFVFLLLTMSAGIAFADGINPNDPYLTEDGTSCGSPHVPWCAGAGLATDPLSGITTLEYTLSSTVYSNVVAGDVLITESTGPQAGQVGDLIRFEKVGSNFEVFIFSDDFNGGQAADHGLPSAFQLNQATITESSSGLTTLYTPTSTQPGYATDPGYAYTSYQLLSPSDVPEPSSLLLLGTGLLSLAGVLRRKLLW